MKYDEFARPAMEGSGTGPRELALYLAADPQATQPPRIPSHIELLEAEVMAAGRGR